MSLFDSFASRESDSGNHIQVPAIHDERFMFYFCWVFYMGWGGLTEFLCQVALGPQLPLIIFIVVIALQGLAVVVYQGERGANERQLDGSSTAQGFKCIF